MIAKDLISDVVPFIRTSDSGQKALGWMEIFRISHLPIVNNEEFLGLISEADIYDYNMADEPIGNHSLSLIKPFVFYYQHIYEVIEIVSRLQLTVIPVLDEKNHYLGLITLNDLLQSFARITAVQNPGGIIILEMYINDLMMSQIAQIVEGNDAKILSMYISSPPESTLLEVTLKINRIDVSAIIQTFERYNYHIKAIYSRDNNQEKINFERYEELLHYLNI
jgi:acetoin utilization protein AcuB